MYWRNYVMLSEKGTNRMHCSAQCIVTPSPNPSPLGGELLYLKIQRDPLPLIPSLQPSLKLPTSPRLRGTRWPARKGGGPCEGRGGGGGGGPGGGGNGGRE